MKLYARKRMQKLADFLKTVPPRSFNMFTWYDISECGTDACMLGHACTIKSFKKAGLKLEKFDKHNSHEELTEFIPLFKEQTMLDAAELFFDITEDEATDLFTSKTKITPKQGAVRLERFLRLKEKERVLCSK